MIDVHSHIDARHPNAKDVKEIVFYEYIMNELRSAGMNIEPSSDSTPADELILKALPFFKQIRNTSSYWCLTTILKHLYNFRDEMTAENWKTLFETIRSKFGNDGWYRDILTRDVKIEKTLLTFRYDEDIPAYDQDFFVGSLRIDSLVNVTGEAVERLEETAGISIGSLNEFEDGIERMVSKFKGHCAAITAYFPPDIRFREANRSSSKRIFRELIIKRKLGSLKKEVLRSYIVERILHFCQENALPFQVMLGVRKPVSGAAPPDYAIAGFEGEMVSSFCPILERFKSLNFDFFLASRIASHELTVLAKNYPNVYVTGYWWYTFYPSIMKDFLRERLEMLPYSKISAFFSDAPVVEWSFGKASLARLQLASVLAEMVDKQYYSESLAKEIAHNVLYDNAKRLYRL